MIVVDVSILFGFVVNRDDYHPLAVAARERDPDWQTPRRFRSEFRSIAAGHLRRGEPLPNVLATAANAQMAVVVHEVNDQEVFAIVQESSLSVRSTSCTKATRRRSDPAPIRSSSGPR